MQSIEVGQAAGIESGIDRIGEFGLAGAVMGERAMRRLRKSLLS